MPPSKPPSKKPLTKAEVYVIMYHRAHMKLPVPAVEEIFRLKIKPFSPLTLKFVSDSVTQICLDEEIKGNPPLRDSKRNWHESALKDFLEETASGLKADEQLYLRQIDDDEKEKINRAVNAEKSKRDKAPKHHDSHNKPKHKRNTHYTDSPKGPRHEHGSPRSYHYQIGGSSTATNFQSPYASSVNNYGRVIDNQTAYNSAPYGGGLANAGAPLQSLDYSYPAPTTQSNYQTGAPSQSLGYPRAAPAPTAQRNYQAGAPSQSLGYPHAPTPSYSDYQAGTPSQSLGYSRAAPAPTPYSNSQAGVPSQSFGYPYTAPARTPYSGYHTGSNDREGERRSTRPGETSGSTSTAPPPKGPRAPGGRDVFC